MSRSPILQAAAKARGLMFAKDWARQQPAFCCVLAHTDTCLLPGLSAAGINVDVRPRTPAADAEVVSLGRPVCLPSLPSNPLGAAGPAGITCAALRLVGVTARFVGAGLRVWPASECLQVGGRPGGDISQGHAVPDARALFAAGYRLGLEYANRAAYLVLGESVPGGTTTALAVLLGLGYRAAGRVSGSIAGNAHALKLDVACTALRTAGLKAGDGRDDPLATVAAVGDPMQPLAVGLALGATSVGCDVLLAGGSQMIAVAALLEAMFGAGVLDRVAVGTTRWVVEDPAADLAGLAGEVCPELAVLAANLDFSGSRHASLRAYERFLVKEGVGAGGACIAAVLATGLPIETLERAIDATYEPLLGRLQGTTLPRPRFS